MVVNARAYAIIPGTIHFEIVLQNYISTSEGKKGREGGR